VSPVARIASVAVNAFTAQAWSITRRELSVRSTRGEEVFVVVSKALTFPIVERNMYRRELI
jgi:hypothetical protein